MMGGTVSRRTPYWSASDDKALALLPVLEKALEHWTDDGGYISEALEQLRKIRDGRQEEKDDRI